MTTEEKLQKAFDKANAAYHKVNAVKEKADTARDKAFLIWMKAVYTRQAAHEALQTHIHKGETK